MPVSIGREGCWLESKQQKEIKNIRYFIVENAKSARNALKMVDLAAPVQELKLLQLNNCLLYTSPSPRDQRGSRMPSSA